MKFTVTTADGYAIGARVWEPNPGGAVIVVAGATAVPQRFYERFARFMSVQGFNVITFDYRGIAESKHGPLKGFNANYMDWAERDTEAVFNVALNIGPTLVVGHSFGGHAFGLVASSNKTLGLYTFATGAGWHGHMIPRARPKVLFMWNVLGPILTTARGYLPASSVGMGEDLPLGVYQQWRRWCKHPNYWFDDPEVDFEPRFAEVRVPIVAENATDDSWAPPNSARAFMSHYTNAPLSYRTLEPSAIGERTIEHMGYFREHIGLKLWPRIVEWARARIG